MCDVLKSAVLVLKSFLFNYSMSKCVSTDLKSQSVTSNMHPGQNLLLVAWPPCMRSDPNKMYVKKETVKIVF